MPGVLGRRQHLDASGGQPARPKQGREHGMRLGDRIALWAAALCLIAVSVLLVVYALLPGHLPVKDWLHLAAAPPGRLAAGTGGLVLLGISMRLCRQMVGKDGRPQVVTYSTDLGTVTIHPGAILTLIGHVTRTIPGVGAVQPAVAVSDNQVSAKLRLTVTPDIDIMALTREIQSAVRRAGKSLLGSEITRVDLTVTGIAAGKPQRTRS